MVDTVKAFNEPERISPKSLLLSNAFFHLSLKEEIVVYQISFENHIEILKLYNQIIWKLFSHEFFKYFRNNRQNTYWSIIILQVSRALFESRWKTQCILMTRYLHWIEELSAQQKILHFIPKLWRGYRCLAQLY